MAERYAVYYAPPATGPLWERAAAWLGRDAQTSETFEGPLAGIDRDRLLNFTAAPSRYGFHATLRAPMSLRPPLGRKSLEEAVAEIAAAHGPVPLGPMHIAELDGFLAIVPQSPPPELQAFAQAVVEALEPARAPLTQRERGRRLAGTNLSDRHRELIEQYGYPFVAEEFFFHMTLTERLAPEALPEIRGVAESWFAPVLGALTLDSLSIFVEPKPQQEFRRIRDFALSGDTA